MNDRNQAREWDKEPHARLVGAQGDDPDRLLSLSFTSTTSTRCTSTRAPRSMSLGCSPRRGVPHRGLLDQDLDAPAEKAAPGEAARRAPSARRRTMTPASTRTTAAAGSTDQACAPHMTRERDRQLGLNGR